MKACPFCASTVLGHIGKPPLDAVQCEVCGARGPIFSAGTRDKRWNHRATTPADLKDRLAEIASDLSDFAEGIRNLSK